MVERSLSVRWHVHNDPMNQVMMERTSARPQALPNGSRGTAASTELTEALELLARHVAFIQAGRREGRDAMALDLVSADIECVLSRAGLTHRLDDRGDQWAELDGRPLMWLGHVPARERSGTRP